MALAWAWRADDANIYARNSSWGKQGVLEIPGGPTRGADAGAIGGFSIDCTHATMTRVISFAGKNVLYNSAGISMVVRFKPNYTGTPAASKGLMQVACGQGPGAIYGSITILHAITSGNILVSCRNMAGTNVLNAVSLGNWNPTSGTWYDLVFTWDWSATANSFKFYIDGVSLGNASPSAAFVPTSTITSDNFKILSLGGHGLATSVTGSFNEGAVWNSVIDPTGNIPLESGNGLLNGASRTSFVSDVAGQVLTDFDGLNSTDPGIANVTSGTNYFINGVSYTGTYSPPSGGGSQVAVIGIGNNKVMGG